jgi:magnesium transporter
MGRPEEAFGFGQRLALDHIMDQSKERRGRTMVRFMKQISRKAGLPPGTLVHIGEKKTEKGRIRLIAYNEDDFEERDLSSVEECSSYKEKSSVTWINVDGIHQPDIAETIGRQYDLHPLVLEDILNTDQRPKVEDYERYLFLTLKMITYDEQAKMVHAEQVSIIILGPSFVISFQEREGDVFDPVRDRLRKGKGRIRKSGPDYLAYALMDAVVDNYFLVLERVGEDIEELEEEVVGNPGPETVESVQNLKRELLYLRKSVWPLREAILGLEKGGSPLIADKTAIYLRDVYDHSIQIIDTVETFRDMVSGMVDIYLSSVSNRMNQIMKVLTIIATLFIPLTFIVGVYGMNFKYMPELQWRYGYFIVWAIMIAIGVLMLLYFRKKKWL